MTTLIVDEFIKLELVNEEHAEELYHLIITNRNILSEWLPWVYNMESVDFIYNFIKQSRIRNEAGIEYAYSIFYKNKIAGRIGIYEIDSRNKIGSIGYWLGSAFQGHGTILKSCNALLSFCFNELKLNRVEIKCGSDNFKSQSVPERLKFYKEGVLRQAEFHNDKFIDLIIFSMLKEEWALDEK